MRKAMLSFIISLLLWGCFSKTDEVALEKAYQLGAIGAFGEAIDAGVKQMALSATLTPSAMDAFMEDAKKVADKNHVLLYREPDLLVTDLFPADVASGKEVLVIYQNTTLDQYLQLKADKDSLVKAGRYEGKSRQDIARRFGRMLSYSPQKINQLMAQNTSFRTLHDFGVRASNLFLYYKDLDKATRFYTETLGMELLADYTMAKILRVAPASYLILVDATKGMHTDKEPKTVAVALLTDQLEEWHQHLKSKNVKIKYDYSPKEGSPHDGFVAVDPEGYLLEFEQFKQHPENERFIPLINTVKSTASAYKNPTGLGFYSSITWLYYKDLPAMEKFYREVLGLEKVADQGWAKIYKVSTGGYVGLVDERRGMHSFSETKAVNVSFLVDDLDGWHRYVSENKPFTLRSPEIGTGPDSKYRAFVGYDPEGYYMEFDIFYDHKDNERLMAYLRSDKQ